MATQPFTPIAILGAGSWGTALALHLASKGQVVRIWSIEKAEIAAMLKDHANVRYLPGRTLPDNIQPQYELAETLEGVHEVLMVVPSIGFRDTLQLAKSHLSANAGIICATKGIDEATGSLLNKVMEEVLGSAHAFAVLSGPSFAREVGEALPTAVTIASKDQSFAAKIKKRFDNALFRTTLEQDVVGVEIGGIIKNVIAIATGIGDGLEYGSNFRSALITFGLKEMTALGVAFGGEVETFVGLSGIGDLILTCSDNQSRNRRLGLALGKGDSVAEALKEIGQVVEGQKNAELLCAIADEKGVDLPICQTVLRILQSEIEARPAFSELLSVLVP